jgi:hypothetical protein
MGWSVVRQTAGKQTMLGLGQTADSPCPARDGTLGAEREVVRKKTGEWGAGGEPPARRRHVFGGKRVPSRAGQGLSELPRGPRNAFRPCGLGRRWSVVRHAAGKQTMLGLGQTADSPCPARDGTLGAERRVRGGEERKR